MRKKLIEKWLMYHEIHRQRREGLKSAQIARELVMERRRVKKYLAMSEDEYLDFIDNQLRRQKVLVPYEDFVRALLDRILYHCEVVRLSGKGYRLQNRKTIFK